ncbi:MAG: hypothetical protein PF487_12325 [Bacteroidales bacterium]|jgi:hypothetical protein|nr:hypothetical protein [Bacteroidales bacterium]
MKELRKINKLLAKFYNGDSSESDEVNLIEFFCETEVPDELSADKELFLYLKSQQQKSMQNTKDLSQKIWQNIQSSENKKRITIKRNFSILTGIAASILIFIVSYFIISNKSFLTQDKYQFADSYSNPEIAYKETRQALLYISEKFNKGTEQLKPITKFNYGIQELSPITKYNKATQYIK